MAPTSLRVKEKAGDFSLGGQIQVRGDLAEDSASDDGVRTKDQAEERLEKLLFGDDAGFLDGLKARSDDQQLLRGGKLLKGFDDDDDGRGGDVGDRDLAAIADENVRKAPHGGGKEALTLSIC